MSKVFMIAAMLAVSSSGAALAQQGQTMPPDGMRPATMTTTTDCPPPSPDKKAWFGHAVDHILTGSTDDAPAPAR